MNRKQVFTLGWYHLLDAMIIIITLGKIDSNKSSNYTKKVFLSIIPVKAKKKKEEVINCHII